MKTTASALSALAILALCTSMAMADKTGELTLHQLSGASGGDCPLVGYKGVHQPLDMAEVPDNDPAGVSFGPLIFPPDNATILDVVVDIEMTHTWVGDLIVTLEHVDASGAVRTVDLIQRPGVPESSFGCAGDLIEGGTYYFGTMGAAPPIGEFDCPAQLPFGCYEVAVENPGGLQQWVGLPKDGEWFLHVSDNAAGDLGVMLGWSVHLLNEPIATPVDAKSWGAIKASYK